MSVRHKINPVNSPLILFLQKATALVSFRIKGVGFGILKSPFTLPGEQVRATMQRKHSDIYGSVLEEIINPSPQRIPGRCKHFGVCGGCRLQHMPYEMQLAEKEKLISVAFLLY